MQAKLWYDNQVALPIASNPARDRMGGEKTTVETVYGISYRKEVVNEQLYTTVYQLFL